MLNGLMGLERQLMDGAGHWGWRDIIRLAVGGAQRDGAGPWGAGQGRHTQASCKTATWPSLGHSPAHAWPTVSLREPQVTGFVRHSLYLRV